VAERPVSPHFADAGPQLLAVVQWDEGPRFTTEIVEATPDELELIEPADGFLAHTNHFCTRALERHDAGAEVMPSSRLRLERVSVLAGAPAGSAEIRAALADHANFPNAVCCHPDPAEDELERDVTAVSLIMDLDARRVELADGNPCCTPYRELDYAELLAA
jgi:isopenicillin-N N-acyltransferase-like protein